MRRALAKRRMLYLMDNRGLAERMQAFLAAMESYQAGHGGVTAKNRLWTSWGKLPVEIRDALHCGPRKLKRLYRGDDLRHREEVALSWTDNAGYAGAFGYHRIPISEVASFSASIDTSRLRALIVGIPQLSGYDVGDDEGEVILLGTVWEKSRGGSDEK